MSFLDICGGCGVLCRVGYAVLRKRDIWGGIWIWEIWAYGHMDIGTYPAFFAADKATYFSSDYFAGISAFFVGIDASIV